MKPKSTLRHFLTLSGSSLLAVSSASAATLQWDHNADGTPSDGANRWASPTYPNRWWNGTASVNWANSSSSRDDAVFGFGGAGAGVNLGDDTQPNPIYAGNITFNNFTGSYNMFRGNLDFDGTITVNNASTGRVHFDNTAVSGTGSIVLDKGILSLRSGLSYTGTTTANGGTLWLVEKAGMSSGSNFTVNNGVNLKVDVASTVFNTGLSGAGSLGGLLAGTTSGNKAITYNGTINLELNLRDANSGDFAGSIASLAGGGTVGNLSISSGTATNALTLSGANSYTGATTIDKATLKLGNGGTTGSLTGTSSITMANSANLTINRSNAFTQATDLNNKAITGSGSFTQAGAGTTTLSLTNTYSGATTVSAGTLLINGSTSSTSLVTVNNGGTLGGTGTIGGSVTLNDGAILSPGASIESLATGSNVWNGGSTLVFEFSTDGSAGAAGTAWDLLAITGTLNLAGASVLNPINFDLVTMADATNSGLLGTWNPNANALWSGFVTTTGGITDFAANLFNIDTTGFQNTINGSFSIAQNGNNLDLVYIAIPEPRAALLGGLGLLALLRRRRD